MMKRTLALLLTLCLVLLSVPALAWKGPQISKQPENGTVVKGKVSFSFKVKGQTAITWYFVNPVTGEETPGKKLNTVFKGIKVSNPNSKKISLSKVPDDMHGWFVYAKAKGDGKTATTDMVQILVKGMPDPEYSAPGVLANGGGSGGEEAGEEEGDGEEEAADTTEEETTEEEEESEDSISASSSSGQEEVHEAAAEEETDTVEETDTGEETDTVEETDTIEETDTVEETDTAEEGDTVDEGTGDEAEAEAEPEPEPEPVGPKMVHVTAKNALLYEMDDNGEPTGEGVSSLTFEEKGDVYVKPKDEEGEIMHWTVNGKRYNYTEGFPLIGITEDTSIVCKMKGPVDESLDYSNMCMVSCTGCYFSFATDDLVHVENGEVPAGAVITVIAGAPDPTIGRKYVVNQGYSVNGGKYEHKNKVTFTLEITEDTTINMKVTNK